MKFRDLLTKLEQAFEKSPLAWAGKHIVWMIPSPDQLKLIAQRLLWTDDAKPVGWETDAEWDLEVRAFNWMPSWPEEVSRKLMNDLWRQYCFAADPRKEQALANALRFIEGFEGDELQEGIDDLIAELKAAVGVDVGT